ncbi:hypothetical protein O9992_22155 [Vibrio lentus]|nr:hypothetical protein [Vibrio lentus]
MNESELAGLRVLKKGVWQRLSKACGMRKGLLSLLRDASSSQTSNRFWLSSSETLGLTLTGDCDCADKNTLNAYLNETRYLHQHQ